MLPTTLKRLYFLALAGALGLAASPFGAERFRLFGEGEAAEERLPAAPAARVSITAEGHVVTYPGAHVVVGAESSGILDSVTAREKDRVRAGATLAMVRATDLQAAIDEARARLGEVDAEIRLSEAELARAERLARNGTGSQQAQDRARRDRETATARRATSLAEIRRLEAVLAKSRILAPIDGVVIERHVDPGEAVTTGSPIVTVADLNRVRVEAEVDELDAARIELGAPVRVRAEGFEQTWSGRVEEIPDSVTNRRIKPQDPARPTDTRVLLVKVALAHPTPLKLGQRVEVAIAR